MFQDCRKYQNTDKIFLQFLKPDFVRNTIKDGIADKKKIVRKYITADFYLVSNIIINKFTNKIITVSKNIYQ
jgi:hypothetical protein